jgi:purine-binding chemotaxis protein CheW
MKNNKGKRSKPSPGSGHIENVKPELKELLNGIESEIKTAQQDKVSTSSPSQKNKNRIDIGRHICIGFGNMEFAISISSVSEAGESLSVQSLPLLPEWISGITNIRGEILSVVDLNLFFGAENITSQPSYPKSKTKPYLIVHNADTKLAITTDKILATRPLFRLIDNGIHKTKKKDMISDYIADRAFYERDGIRSDIFLFDLEKFLTSGNLHDFSIA